MTKKEQFLAFLRREPGVEAPEGFPFLDLGPWPEGLRKIGSSMDLMMCPDVQMLDAPTCERPMVGAGYDVFGVHWSATAEISHYTPGQAPIYTDITHWREQVRIPNVDRLDWDTFRRYADALDPEKVVSVTLFSGLFERATVLTSMQECLMDAISEPEDFADMIGAIADYKIALIHKMCDYAPIDLLTYHDDWGTNNSTFLSPALWREVIRPHTQRVYDAAHARGVYLCQHSCGCTSPLLPDMIEMGADAWDAQKSCNDLLALQKEYGDRIFLMANDILNAGTPKDSDLPPITSPYPAWQEKPEFLFT